MHARRLLSDDVLVEVFSQPLADADGKGTHLPGRRVEQNHFIGAVTHGLQLRWFRAGILDPHYGVDSAFGVFNDIDRTPFRPEQVSAHLHKVGYDELPEVFKHLSDR